MVSTAPHTSPSELRPTDGELTRRALTDPAAFEQLFRRHVEAIHGFTCARVGPIHAEDVTADTFAIAYRSLHRFDQRATSMRPWLYGIAVNQLRKHREHERIWLDRARLQASDAPADLLVDVDERLDAARHAPRLARALALLSSGERDVLVLWVLEDLDHAQIAATLGIRTGTAKTRLSPVPTRSFQHPQLRAPRSSRQRPLQAPCRGNHCDLACTST